MVKDKGRASKGKEGLERAPDQDTDPLRVWWPPTANKERTGFSGAYWPAAVIGKRRNGKYIVEYDNGEVEDVITENLAPDDPPVEFGHEEVPLQPTEFCEVSNNSPTDPCAWVGMVHRQLASGSYLVKYPFHDAPSEEIQPHLIRRARVLDLDGWCLLKPNQRWVDGDVLSPHELEVIKEEQLGQYVDLSSGQNPPVIADRTHVDDYMNGPSKNGKRIGTDVKGGAPKKGRGV